MNNAIIGLDFFEVVDCFVEKGIPNYAKYSQ